MAKLRDDNLENFFLNRVNEYKIDYKEEDWTKLNEMLDASVFMKAVALKQKMVWVGSGTLLVISIVLLLWMSQNLTSRNTDSIIAPSDIATSDVEIIEGSDGMNANQMDIVQPIMEENDPSLLPGNYQPNSETKSSNNTSNPEIENNSDQNNEIVEGIDNHTIDENAVIDPDNNINNVQPYVIPIGTEMTREEALIKPLAEPANADNAGIVTGIRMNSKGWDLSPSKSDGIIMITDPIKSNNELNLRKNYAWNFSVAADYSAVGVSDFDGPALRAGLSFEYYTSPRFSVLAGVNYSQKAYSAFGREYKPPYGYWTNGIVPDETYGECNVLDIPINFSYYFPNAREQAFFVRAGISSWLMLEEHYYYNYQSNDPDLVRYWGGENENYHYFSILNFSAGIENPLGDRFSLLLEPYINIPLGGVGFGQVDLYSAGLKFTMKVNHFKISIIDY